MAACAFSSRCVRHRPPADDQACSRARSKSAWVSAHEGTPPSSCGTSKRFSSWYSIIQRRKPMGDSATIRTSFWPRMSMWYSILAAKAWAPTRRPRRSASVW